MGNFASIVNAPDGQEPSRGEFVNYVSMGVVGHDPEDPSLAFVRMEGGQVLVEVELAGDGDAVNAYLCHSQTGADAGDYIPVAAGEAVVLVWPDGQSSSPYIIARLADVERQLAGSCCGLDTTGVGMRQFRWLRTPTGQVFAVQSGGELYLSGGGSGVRIGGEQIMLSGAVHIGSDFTAPPIPGEPAGGELETPTIPAVPFIPLPGISLAEVPPTTPPLADGIIRFSDTIESNILTDPDFWSFILAVNSLLIAVAAFIGVPWPYNTPETLPKSIKPQHTSSSGTHTCTDPPPV